jgi:hypothetical protein
MLQCSEAVHCLSSSWLTAGHICCGGGGGGGGLQKGSGLVQVVAGCKPAHVVIDAHAAPSWGWEQRCRCFQQASLDLGACMGSNVFFEA